MLLSVAALSLSLQLHFYNYALVAWGVQLFTITLARSGLYNLLLHYVLLLPFYIVFVFVSLAGVVLGVFFFYNLICYAFNALSSLLHVKMFLNKN